VVERAINNAGVHDVPTHYGYDGDTSEEALVKAFNELATKDSVDSVTKLKTVYWTLGCILKAAIDRGYCEKKKYPGGARQWIADKLLVSRTFAYACKSAWETRHDFDEAYKWYQTGNTVFKPKAATGPVFQNEIVKAWKNRNKPEPLPKAKKEKPNLVHIAARWKNRYEWLRDEVVKRYAPNGECIVLNQIERDISQDDYDDDEESFPVLAAAEPEAEPAVEIETDDDGGEDVKAWMNRYGYKTTTESGLDDAFAVIKGYTSLKPYLGDSVVAADPRAKSWSVRLPGNDHRGYKTFTGALRAARASGEFRLWVHPQNAPVLETALQSEPEPETDEEVIIYGHMSSKSRRKEFVDSPLAKMWSYIHADGTKVGPFETLSQAMLSAEQVSNYRLFGDDKVYARMAHVKASREGCLKHGDEVDLTAARVVKVFDHVEA
jgi:hypothetical protein